MKTRFTARYRCMGKHNDPECRYEWRIKQTDVTCPKCGSRYVEWLNYKEVRDNGFRDRSER